MADVTKPKEPDEFYIQALLLAEVIKRILDRKASIHLSRVADFKLKPIIEFRGRMRVSSIDKFDGIAYISFVYFYLTEDDKHAHKPVGVILIYMEDEYIEQLLRKLDYPRIDADNQDMVEDACGTICNLIAGNFKTGLTQLGYHELHMSHFTCHRTDIVNGVDFPRLQNQKYEISFVIESKKRIMAELIMAPLLKV
jgi:hypothetical protein